MTVRRRHLGNRSAKDVCNRPTTTNSHFQFGAFSDWISNYFDNAVLRVIRTTRRGVWVGAVNPSIYSEGIAAIGCA